MQASTDPAALADPEHVQEVLDATRDYYERNPVQARTETAIVTDQGGDQGDGWGGLMIDSSAIEGTRFGRLLVSVRIYTDRQPAAELLLNDLHDVVNDRLVELREAAEREGVPEEIKLYRHPPAVEAHVFGPPATLVDDMLCREHLEHLARHGWRAGVTVYWHGDLDLITEAFSRSARLTAELMSGHAFRYVAPERTLPWRRNAAPRAGSGNGPLTEDPYGNRPAAPTEKPAPAAPARNDEPSPARAPHPGEAEPGRTSSDDE